MCTAVVDGHRANILAARRDIWLFFVCRHQYHCVERLQQMAHLHGWHACRTRLARRSGVWLISFMAARGLVVINEGASNASRWFKIAQIDRLAGCIARGVRVRRSRLIQLPDGIRKHQPVQLVNNPTDNAVNGSCSDKEFEAVGEYSRGKAGYMTNRGMLLYLDGGDAVVNDGLRDTLDIAVKGLVKQKSTIRVNGRVNTAGRQPTHRICIWHSHSQDTHPSIGSNQTFQTPILTRRTLSLRPQPIYIDAYAFPI